MITIFIVIVENQLAKFDQKSFVAQNEAIDRDERCPALAWQIKTRLFGGLEGTCFAACGMYSILERHGLTWLSPCARHAFRPKEERRQRLHVDVGPCLQTEPVSNWKDCDGSTVLRRIVLKAILGRSFHF